jgi:hypothetical protein
VVGDLWFDVTGNGARDPGEGLVEILNATLNPLNEAQAAAPLTVRFDLADAAWLAAYADLLSAFCHVILAYDPTEPITRILTARAEMAKLGPATPDLLLGGERVPDSVDMVAMVLATLNQTPDKALMAEAQTDLLQMIAENRQFWARVEAETDDRAEWLPNARQTSALGITVPPDAAVAWQAVLAEMEAVVKGDKLLPYWRVGPPAGINVAKIFTDPRPVDLAGWVQGWAALPYLQTGTLASAEAMDAFDQAAMGDSMLFAIYFN